MTFEEWREKEGLLETYNAVESAKDAWNAAIEEMKKPTGQQAIGDRVEPIFMCEIPINLLSEIKGYLIAASDGSMSRNNSEALADELLEAMNKLTA